MPSQIACGQATFAEVSIILIHYSKSVNNKKSNKIRLKLDKIFLSIDKYGKVCYYND